jgi:antitoxin component YwqK of YwqJK toxin-antitoxin module
LLCTIIFVLYRTITLLMKPYLITLLTALCCFSASAQTTPNHQQRNIRIDIIGKDSVKLFYDDDFTLIEDSCSHVTRRGHLSRDQKFNGRFEDISVSNPQLILTTGTYEDGLKQGVFVINYPDGKLQAKGNFKNNLFDGKWELFYEDGKPKLSFEANESDLKILDAWDTKGIKTVDNGKGLFKADLGFVYWKGKLLNGKPDGTWKSKRANDDEDLYSESYKNGVFQKGNSNYGEYTNETRLMLVNPNMFKFVQAERFLVSNADCSGNKPKSIVYAHYTSSVGSFTGYVQNAITTGISGLNWSAYDGSVIIDGEVGKDGAIQNLRTRQTISEEMANAIIRKLYTLPALSPAKVDGKPTKQKFFITAIFSDHRYNFTCQFLPVEDK